jgi:hypothetical protein
VTISSMPLFSGGCEIKEWSKGNPLVAYVDCSSDHIEHASV